MDVDVDPAGQPYRLVSLIDAHHDDIKSIQASHTLSQDYAEQLLTVSRDATCKSWGRRPAGEAGTSSSLSADWTHIETFKASDRYLNAVTALEPCDEMLRGQVIFGGLDHIIYCYAPSPRPDPTSPVTKPAQMLLEHWDNVTSLSIWRSQTQDERGARRTFLISSSWDYSARVHELDVDTASWRPLHFLRGAEAAVWGACVLEGEKGRERYLTTSADLFIRLYEGEKLSVIYPGHDDVPRSTCSLPPLPHPSSTHSVPIKPYEPLFLTCSNDASLRVWSLDPLRRDPANQTRGPDALRVLIPPRGEDGEEPSIVYEARALGGDRVASVGENGVLRIWNYDEGELLQTLRSTATSLWSLCLLPQSKEIATAGSDGRIRIYSPQADAVEIQDALPRVQGSMRIDGERERRENDEELPEGAAGEEVMEEGRQEEMDTDTDTGARIADEMLAQALDSVPQGSKELASSSLRLLHALLDRTLIAALDLIDRDMVYRILPPRLSRHQARRRRRRSHLSRSARAHDHDEGASGGEQDEEMGYWHVLSSDAPAEADMSAIAKLNALDFGVGRGTTIEGMGQGKEKTRSTPPRSYAVFPSPLRRRGRDPRVYTPGFKKEEKEDKGEERATRTTRWPAFCECPAFAIRCWGLDVEGLGSGGGGGGGARGGGGGDVGVLESTRTPSKGVRGGMTMGKENGHVVVMCKHLLAVELARRLKRYQTWKPDVGEVGEEEEEGRLLDVLCLV